MKKSPKARRAAAALVSALALSAGPPLRAQSAGADVAVGGLNGVMSYGSAGGVHAFAIGTTACNVGSVPLQWQATTTAHPVIAQNVYRLHDGRFAQVGMSWLKHGFATLAESYCLPCAGGGGSTLAVGCSDAYSAGLNGAQDGLGPRYEVDAATGAFAYPFAFQSQSNFTLLERRIQIQGADLGPPGALYFGEAQYVSADDAAAGNGKDNASWRRLAFAPQGANYMASLSGPTARGEPAIFAWKAEDPLVRLQAVDVPGDGRFWVGYRAYPLGGGLWRHEYAVHNLDSSRAAGGFSLAPPAGIVATNPTFRDVDYHSGEPFDGADWAATIVPGGVSFATTPFATDPLANALRFATLYNFGFDAPVEHVGDAALSLFAPGPPGAPPAMSFALCPATGLPTTKQVSYVAQSVPYDFVALGAAANPGPSGASGSTLATLPFPFPLYDRTLTQVRIGVEGHLAAPEQFMLNGLNAAIPTDQSPNAFAAPFWDNLTTAPPAGFPTGTIVYGTVGVAPNRRFVVHWNVYKALGFGGSGGNENFQAILEENGDVVFTWVATLSGGSSATVGLEEESGRGGTALSFNAAGSVTAGTSKRLVRTTIVPASARLDRFGDGSYANPLRFRYVGAPDSVLILGADLVPGPTDLGPFGTFGLGLFGPTFVAVADGFGLFAPADPTAVADDCGVWERSFAFGPAPLPDLDVFVQAVGWNLSAPNGFFDLSTVSVLF